jgi:hypothetical protein
MYSLLALIIITVVIAIVIGFGELAYIGPLKEEIIRSEFISLYETIFGITFFGMGVPFLILCFIKGIPSKPMTFTTLDSPFVTFVELDTHMKNALSLAGYHGEVTMTGEEGLTLYMSHKTTLFRVHVFGIVYAPILNHPTKSSFEEMANNYMERHLDKLTKDVYLTLLICVEKGSKDYSNFIRRYGQTLGRFYVHIGFDFDRHAMSFVSKIDGFAAGKRKELLKDFLAMLPSPEKYTNLRKLAGKKGKNSPKE